MYHYQVDDLETICYGDSSPSHHLSTVWPLIRRMKQYWILSMCRSSYHVNP